METIHFISDFKYFSARQLSPSYKSVWHSLLCHINYISRKGSEVHNLSKEVWKERVSLETQKRWDSRVALSFVMALPNGLTFEKYKQILLNFLSKELNVPQEHISFAIHRSQNNTHAHILIYPRDKNFKKLRINRSQLQKFHRNWDKFLRVQGFFVKREEETIGKLPPLSPLAQKVYEEHYKLKQMKKQLELLSNSPALKTISPPHFSFFEKVKQLLEEKMTKTSFIEKQKSEIMRFLKALNFNDDDKIAIEAIKNGKRVRMFNNNIIKVKHLTQDNVLRVLRALNSKGFNIYFSLNTLKEDASNRKKSSFNSLQNKIYIDLDSKKLSGAQMIARFYAFLQKYDLPSPTIILKSSRGNYQIIWTFEEKIDFSTLEKVMVRIESELDTDPVHDISRIFRLPYFFNTKYSPSQLVVLEDSLTVYNANGEKVAKIYATYKPVSFENFKKLSEDIKYPLSHIVKKIEEKKKSKEIRLEVVKEITEEKVEKLLAREYLEKVYKQSHNSPHPSPSEADLAFVARILNGLTPQEREKAKIELIEFLAQKSYERGKRSSLEKAREYAEKTVSKYIPLSSAFKKHQKANISTSRTSSSSRSPRLS